MAAARLGAPREVGVADGSDCCRVAVWVATVVDGLPVVPEAKHEKLAGVLNKIYSQIGHVREGECSSQQQP